MQNPNIIKELHQAFSKTPKDGVIDLDQFLVNRDSLSILRLEDFYKGVKSVIPPYRQSNFFILFAKEAKGKRSIGHYTFPIENNSLVIIPKYVIHAAMYASKPTGYFISFNPDFFLQQSFPYKLLNTRRILKPSLRPYMTLRKDQAEKITWIFENIIEECNSGFEGKKQMIALKILELLILCDQFFTEKAERECILEYCETLEKLNELIETNFLQHRDVHFYAGALHSHPNYLNHIVKKATGLTAKQIITNRLMIEAKYLLASTGLSIKEIAYKLGFEDPNYFHSFFKKEENTTPANYRSQLT